MKRADSYGENRRGKGKGRKEHPDGLFFISIRRGGAFLLQLLGRG